MQSNMHRLWRSTLIISVCHRSTWRLFFVQQLAPSPMQHFQQRTLALSKYSAKSSAPSPNYDVTAKEEEDSERKDNSESSENRRIFIGNLLRGKIYISEDKLVKYFSRYGEIEGLEFFRCKFTNFPRGFAFITFRDVESVQRVLAESHFIDNLNVKTEAAANKRKNIADRKRDLAVFVTRVMKHVDKETIARHFSQFGGVDRVILAKEEDDGLDSYYVLFSTLSGASKALEEPNQRIAEQTLVKSLTGSLRIFKDPQRSLKILKDLLKILKDEDLSKIFQGSLKDPQRSQLLKLLARILEDILRIL